MTMYIGSVTTPQLVFGLLQKAQPQLSNTAAANEWAEFSAFVVRTIPQVSTMLATKLGRVFVPYYATRKWYLQDSINEVAYRRQWFFSNEDALDVLEVKVAGEVYAANEWRVIDENYPPYWGIKFNRTPLQGWDFNDAIEIAGWWGYHRNPQTMYSTIETIAGTLSNSATTLTVVSAAAYQDLQYLRLDDELVQVVARNTTTNVLTVERGVQGTAAASHSAFNVRVFTPMLDVQMMATRIVAWYYQKRNDVGDRAQSFDGSFTLPSTISADLAQLAEIYQRKTMYLI